MHDRSTPRMECEFGCIASAILGVMRTPSFHLVSAPSLPLPSRPHRPQLSLQPPTPNSLFNPPPRQNCRPPPCALSRHLQPAPGQSASPSVNTTTTPQTTAVQPAAWLAGVCLSTHHQCRELPPITTTSACLKPFAWWRRLLGTSPAVVPVVRGRLASHRNRSSSTQGNRRSE